MAGYVPLPAYQVPRNAMLDFSGLNAGIDAINERNQQDRLAAERKEERTYQRGRNAMADRRYAEETAYRHGRDQLQDQRYADETAYTRGRQGVVDQRAATEFSNSQEDRAQTKFTERVKLLAPHVEKYVIGEKDPALRAQRWNDVLATKGLENAPDQFRDPVTGPDLFLSTARGFLGQGKYGKTGAIFQGPDKKFYSVQFNEDGSRKIEPFETGLAPAKGVTVVGDEVISDATGDPVRNVGGAIAAAEARKEEGTAAGKARAAAPADIDAANNALDLVGSLRDDPNRQWGTGASAMGNWIPATPGYDYQNKVDQAKSGAFLTAIQQMRGLGALSNAEGQTATQAVTRMNTATSEPAFLQALDDYEKIIRQGLARAQSRVQPQGGQPPPSAPDPLGIR